MNDEVAFSTEVALDSKGLYVQIFSSLSYFEDITDLRGCEALEVSYVSCYFGESGTENKTKKN